MEINARRVEDRGYASPRSINHPVSTPVEFHAALADAFSRGDLDEMAALYEPDATLVAPPDGFLAPLPMIPSTPVGVDTSLAPSGTGRSRRVVGITAPWR